MGVVAIGPLAPSIAGAQATGESAGDISSVGIVSGLRSTSQTGTGLVLNWQTLPGTDLYRVYVDGALAASDDDGWVTVRWLSPLQTYTIEVSAVRGGVEGERSDPIEVTTSDITLPIPNINVDLQTRRLSSTLVPFAVQDVFGASIQLFRDGVELDAAALGDSRSRLLDRDVTPGATYVYQARFVSEATGAVGEFAPDIIVTVPGNVADVTNTFTDRQVVVLRLDDLDGRTPYEVERNGEIIGVFSQNVFIASQWFGDRTVEAGETYTYRVRVTPETGAPGPWSEAVTTTTPEPRTSTSTSTSS